MKPLISIIVPVFNGIKHINSLYQNLRSQTYSNFEVIFIDDKSEDNSIKIIESLKAMDPRVKLICLDENSGPGLARDKGIAAAKGEFIAFLDVDDIWKKDKLLNQLTFMQENDYVFTFHDYSIVKNNIRKKIKNMKEVNFEKILVSRPIAIFTVMISKKIINEISFYHPNRELPEDFLAWLKILRNHKAYNVGLNLGDYSSSSDSRSGQKIKASYFAFKVYREVLNYGIFRSISFWLKYSYFSYRKHYS